ncbi:hypothetical protein [Streptomyces cyaneus]|uniref:hypothetical protein n=1 Tax=Streptomyces cyaneus TaxID=1904 RepID=UPI0013E345EE|nr:hypothetical protein [Streptomyces cyaneus]
MLGAVREARGAGSRKPEAGDGAVAWPPAPDCGDPHDLGFKAHTRLTPADPAADCGARPACAAILDRAGPEASYQRRLGLH